MFKYDKKLPYPVDIKKKDLKIAKYIIIKKVGESLQLFYIFINFTL